MPHESVQQDVCGSAHILFLPEDCASGDSNAANVSSTRKYRRTFRVLQGTGRLRLEETQATGVRGIGAGERGMGRADGLFCSAHRMAWPTIKRYSGISTSMKPS